METSLQKSSFLYHNVSDASLTQIQGLFPFKGYPLDKGIKYLGFILKPNCYGIEDWKWLVKKIENKIQN